MMRRALLPTMLLFLLALPLWMPGTVDAEAVSTAPLILSAREAGDHLLIRGTDLVPSDRTAPFVTLSGRVLRVEPGFSAHQLRVALPEVEAGSYLLTVAWSRQAPQAGVLAVTLSGSERGSISRGRDHSSGELHACANARHVRIVDDGSECHRNERALLLVGSVEGPQVDVGGEPDDEDDSDAEEEPDGEDDDGEEEEQDDGRGDSPDSGDDADSDEDSDSDGNGKGKNKKKDKGDGGGG